MKIAGREISYIYISIAVLSLGILAAVMFFVFRSGTMDDADSNNGGSFFGFLFGGEPVTPRSDLLDQPGTSTDGKDPDAALFHVAADSVAGAIITRTGDKVRYFKRSTGHLFENTFDGTEEIRISNLTTPAIQTAQWTPSHEYAIISYYANGNLEHLYSQYNGTTSILSAFLPKEIDEIAVSRATDSISYTIRRKGETTLFTANPDNTGIKNIYSTPIGDFELQWPAANRLSMKTKSSAFAQSFLFTLNPTTKRFTRLLSGKEGLDTLWSPSGEEVLYLETAKEGTTVTLRVLSLNEGRETVLPITTLPEKCAWAPTKERVLYCGIPQPIPLAARMPDDWWQGTVSFNDTLWRINIDTGAQQQLLALHPFDITNIFLSESESHVFFTNKKDGSLWSLRLGS